MSKGVLIKFVVIVVVLFGVYSFYYGVPFETKTTIKITAVSKKEKLSKKEKSVLAYKKRFWGVALMEEQKYGIPKEIKLAQGILEQNADKGKLVVKTNNHFSIKCFGKHCPKNHCIAYGNDTHNRYRVYKNDWESFRDHSFFLMDNPRYSSLFSDSFFDFLNPEPRYVRWAKGLQEAGYARDKNYAKSLISVIEKYKLYEQPQ